MQGDVIYEIDHKDFLIFANDAWCDFAHANHAEHLVDAPSVHRSIWDYIADRETRLIYEMMFRKVRERGERVNVTFRCDTPTRRRYAVMDLYPWNDLHIFLICKVLHEEEREYSPLIDPVLARSEQRLQMCSWCKQVQVTDDEWLEVEEAVARLQLVNADSLPQLSHGTCPDCRNLLMPWRPRAI